MGQDNLAPEPTEVGATRYYVFTASEDLLDFKLVGVQAANSRDQALRRQFGKNPPLSVAVSEHAWNVKKPKWKPVPDGFEDVEMPDPGAVPVADDDEPVHVIVDFQGEPGVDGEPDTVPPVEDVVVEGRA